MPFDGWNESNDAETCLVTGCQKCFCWELPEHPLSNETLAQCVEVFWSVRVARDVVAFFCNGVEEVVECTLESEGTG